MIARTNDTGWDGVRSFNRYELKYLADRRLCRTLRTELRRRLEADSYGDSGVYPVWSRYYDSVDLRCYWEKIDGIKFRRKLRVRHYGRPEDVQRDTPVWVEIKQRVNRVTQKRRVRLPYAEAEALCAGRSPASVDAADQAVVEEILAMVDERGLRPSTVIGYAREAFVGRDEDGGLRVTIDSNIRGRDRDLDLAVASTNRQAVHPELSVVEVKVNERAPYWLTDLIARCDMQLVRLSKYCQSVEAFGRAPRSAFHVPEGPDESPARPVSELAGVSR